MEPEQSGSEGPAEVMPAPVSGRRVLLIGLAVLAGIMLLWNGMGEIRKPPPRPPPSVVAEATLMVAAREARDAGDHAAALRALDAHAERYPSGSLAESREAERVAVLCALGHTGEARAAAERFLQRYPDSEQAAQVRRGCGTGD